MEKPITKVCFIKRGATIKKTACQFAIRQDLNLMQGFVPPDTYLLKILSASKHHVISLL